jgi:hypothetical protein
MPIVKMPDGTEVDMPDDPSPELLTRLRAVIAKQHNFKVNEAGDPAALPGETPQPKPGADAPVKPVDFTLGNINKGIAQGVGAPVDVMQDVLNLGKAAVGTAATAMGRPDLAPEIRKNAIGGSQWLESLMEQHKMISDAATPTSAVGRAAAKVLQVGGSALGSAATTVGAARAAAKVENAVRDAPAEGIIRGEEQINKTIRESRREGYVFPPSQVNPSVTNKTLEGFAGKVGTRQEADIRNAAVSNRLAKKALGVSENTPLSAETIDNVRSDAYAVYDKVRGVATPLVPTEKYVREVSELNGEFAALEKKFPGLTKNAEVEELKQVLLNDKARAGLTTGEAIDLSRLLRSKATANYKAANAPGGNPEKLAVAQAQRDAANAVEDLIAAGLKKDGKEALYREWTDARRQLAISHDVESALNPATGTIDARAVASLARKGRPLSGDLEKIANFARAFPHASMPPERVGGVPSSLIDTVLGSVGGAVGGSHGGIEGGMSGMALGMMARPGTRQLLLSDLYQDRMVRGKK